MSGQMELFRLPPPPQATSRQTRHIVLAGRIVAYVLRRDRRRLTLRIDERGLAVGAPRAVPLVAVETFIAAHGDWVVEKLDELAAQPARHLPIHDGARLPVLGGETRVRVVAGANRGYWRGDGAGAELWLAARPAADLSALARRALRRRAFDHFAPRIAAAAALLGRTAPALALSSARTRWGSCSVQSGIRLNWRLIHLAPELIDYVIAHEAAHLVEMNHGPRFWATVDALCPDWRARRDALKRAGAALPLL
jgi:predicted metal-dependent hydrolase